MDERNRKEKVEVKYEKSQRVKKSKTVVWKQLHLSLLPTILKEIANALNADLFDVCVGRPSSFFFLTWEEVWYAQHLLISSLVVRSRYNELSSL